MIVLVVLVDVIGCCKVVRLVHVGGLLASGDDRADEHGDGVLAKARAGEDGGENTEGCALLASRASVSFALRIMEVAPPGQAISERSGWIGGATYGKKC